MASGSLERCSSYKKKVSAFLQSGWHSPTAMGGRDEAFNFCDVCFQGLSGVRGSDEEEVDAS